MAPINGRPFIAYLLDYLSSQGVKRATMAVSYRYDVLMDFLGFEYQGIKLEYSIEEEPQGTGGAIRKALQKTKASQVFIVNGDTMFRVSLSKMKTMFLNQDADMVIGLKQMEHAARYGTVNTGEDHVITGFSERRATEGAGMINGGVYLAKKAFLMEICPQGTFSFEKEILEKKYSRYRFIGYSSDAFFLDIGVPLDYRQAHAAFKRFKDR
jgi:D-glycero-alpha-D-manno-heptose 1-phosphate guanylyltransferase